MIGGRIIAIGSGMLLTVAFANLLPPEIYGTYKYVLATSSFIAAFSLNAIGQGVMRAVATGKKDAVPSIIRTSMLWSIPASIVTLGAATYYFAQGNATLGYGFLFIAVANVLNNGYGLSKSILVAAGDFKANTLSGVPRTLISIAVVLLTLLLTKNVVFILLAYFATNTIVAWSLYRYSVKKLHIGDSKDGVSEAVTFGKHASVLGFFMIISGQIDQLLLFHFTGGAELALYTLALMPVKEAQNLLANFTNILFPKLAKKTKEEIRATLPLRIKQMLGLSLLGAIAYVVCVPFLFKYLFPKYLVSILVSQVLAITILFQFKGVIETLLIAHGEIKKRYVAILTSQAIEFILFCTLIPIFGLWGAVWATVISEACAAITLLVIYKRF